MKMILKRKKAVSPVIATILLIALTVTAAAIVYFVVVPLLQANPELVATGYGKVSGTDNKYEVTIENNGGDSANLAGLTAITFTNTTDDYNPTHVYYSISTEITTWPYVIAQGESVTLVFELGGTFTSGQYSFALEYDSGKILKLDFSY